MCNQELNKILNDIAYPGPMFRVALVIDIKAVGRSDLEFRKEMG